MIEWVSCFVPGTSSFGFVFRQSSGVFSTSWRCRWQPTSFGSTWSYPPKMLSAERTPWRGSANFLSRSDDLSLHMFAWAQVFFMLFRSFRRHRMCLSLSIIFEYIWYICLEPLWICHKSKGMVQAVETVLHCFNMFQHVPLLAKVAEAQLAWSGWQWDHQLWWNRPIRASAFPRKSRNFLSKKRSFSVPWQVWTVNTILSREAWKTCPILLTSFRSSRHERGFWKGPNHAKPVSPSLSFSFIRICSGIHVVHSTAAAGHASLCQLVGRFEGRFARELRWMLRFPATCCGCKAWGEETQGYPGDVRQDLLLK